MACVLTSDFSMACRKAVGGVKKVYITEIANEASFTVASGVVTTFTLSTGKQFFEYELPQNSANATAPISGDRAVGSRFYTHTVNIQLPYMDTATRNEILLLAKNQVMIIVLDQNGKYWLYGHNEVSGATSNGLEISEGTGQTGTASGDLNGFNITFTGDVSVPPMEVSSGLMTTLVTPA